MKKFQSTPPRGWRPCRGLLEGGKDWNFNPLHREGGDDDDLIVLQDILIFQSTPPRGWRLTHNGLAHLLITISIHSTARVETSTV